MKTKIVLCPTLNLAFCEWNRLAERFPHMWVDCRRNPMSLTSIKGTKYIFHSENEVDKLRGCHADVIRMDELGMNIESEDKE